MSYAFANEPTLRHASQGGVFSYGVYVTAIEVVGKIVAIFAKNSSLSRS